MRVNSKTLLFEDVSPAERAEILKVVREIVLEGKVPYPVPPWLDQWMAAAGYDDRQRLLVISTAFPQRALLSLIEQ